MGSEAGLGLGLVDGMMWVPWVQFGVRGSGLGFVDVCSEMRSSLAAAGMRVNTVPGC